MSYYVCLFGGLSFFFISFLIFTSWRRKKHIKSMVEKSWTLLKNFRQIQVKYQDSSYSVRQTIKEYNMARREAEFASATIQLLGSKKDIDHLMRFLEVIESSGMVNRDQNLH